MIKVLFLFISLKFDRVTSYYYRYTKLIIL